VAVLGRVAVPATVVFVVLELGLVNALDALGLKLETVVALGFQAEFLKRR
jgi:hypothetical protein